MNTKEDTPDKRKRRRQLIIATSVVAGTGIVAGTIPLLQSMWPSAKTKSRGGPVDVDFSKLEMGEQITVNWRGKPVWVLYRTARNLMDLESTALRSRLRDPDSKVESQQPAWAENAFRSIKPEYLIVVGICTHLGCVPTYRPERAPKDLGKDWLGGYHCPCHGSLFDLAGRVFKGVPAPTNLVIPPYRFVSKYVVRIGEDAATS